MTASMLASVVLLACLLHTSAAATDCSRVFLNGTVRYAGWGAAVDCLANRMLTPFVEKYTPTVVRMSTLVCANHGAAASAAGALVLALLAILHVSLLVAPMLLIVELFDRLATVSAAKAGATRRNGVTAPGVLLAAMAVFCVASLGEIALHVQQNWVELGLMPSWYNVVFYGALALGQVLLAWGLGGLDVWVLAGLAATTAASLVMAAGTILANGVPDCQAFCAQPIPVVGATISSWNVWLAADGSTPYLAGSLCSYMVVQIVQFAALGFTTGLFLVKAGRRVNSGALVMSLFVAAAYVAGIVCSIVVETMGLQLWHVPTAFAFLLGFLLQRSFILAVLDNPARAHAD